MIDDVDMWAEPLPFMGDGLTLADHVPLEICSS